MCCHPNINLNILNFGLTPLHTVCIKVDMVSVIKLGWMRCLCHVNENIIQILQNVVHGINEGFYGISNKNSFYALPLKYEWKYI